MQSDGSKFRIGISGSYGGMNLGDEAILEGILGELRASIPAEVTVFSKNPADTLARHKVEHAINARSLTRKEVTPAIRELDLLILGGGGILFDGEEDLRPLPFAERRRRLEALVARLDDPRIDLSERPRLERRRPPLRRLAARHEARALEHLQVLADRGEAHGERLRELGHRRAALRQTREDRAARWIGEGAERDAQPVDRHVRSSSLFNYIV